MKKLILFAFLCCCVSTSAFAQTAINALVHTPGAKVSDLPVTQISVPFVDAKYSPLSADYGFTYFDQSAQQITWTVPTSLGSNALMLGIGERFTTPGAYAFLDSIYIGLSSVSGDSVNVLIASDTLLTQNGTTFHYMNIFDQNAPVYGVASIPAAAVQGPQLIKIVFPHTLVPKDFYVTLLPSISNAGQITNNFTIIGDQEASRARTADNAHSIFLAQVNGQSITGPLDSTFTTGTPPTSIYSNLFIVAFLDTAAVNSSVRPTAAAAMQLSSYPNPFSTRTTITVTGQDANASLKVFDAVGRVVADLSSQLHEHGASKVEFDGATLSNGTYFLRLEQRVGSVTTPVLLQH